MGTIRVLLAALLIGVALPAAAQPPAPAGPRAMSVQEQQLLGQLREIDGRVSIPNRNAGVLIQPAGRDWRVFQEQTMTWIGGIAVLGMLGVLVLFYLVRGKVRISAGASGRTIQRFNGFERFVHWLTASTFVVLAISGLNISFGRMLLLPLVGHEAFASLSVVLKYAHNFLAFPFIVGLVLTLLTWIADNIPSRADARWFAAGGGLVGSTHPPAKRFNAGQKLLFWSVVLGGAALSASGVLLLFPLQFTDIAGMQLANMVHGAVGLAMIGIIIAHIYIGSVGMEGAFDAMGSGQVDLNWAREHHSLWVEEQVAKGRAAVPPRGARAAE
ncbi:MAG: formate dehydrogenase subunit gamma [Acetobacteraceae bacterium]|nr:formate dehydrogenase subunit gamma [Acetobacteraceae bacterium]